MHRTTYLSLVSLLSVSCTHWKAQPTTNSSEVVRETLQGGPRIEQTTTATGKVEHRSESGTDIHGNPVDEGVGTSKYNRTETTRCVQNLERVTLVNYDVDYKLAYAPLDYVFGGMLVVLGTSVAIANFQSTTYRPDPPVQIAAGLIVGGGIAMIVHGIVKSNSKPPEPRRNQTREVVEMTVVDATGCPGFGDSTSAPASQDAAKRLRDLKELYDSGVLTEEEYQSRRDALVNEL